MSNRRWHRGSAIVEFALVAPLLLLLTAGVLDFSMLLRTASCISDAARVGAQFGSQSTASASDAAGIRAAALQAAPGVAGMTATPVRTCQCAGGGAVSCSGTCSGPMLVYIAVTTQATAPTVFRYAPLTFPSLVTSTARMRVQ